ncbi:hypothetical protein BT93_K0466 [Corymbia citriodora subsp. variegata]|nr:hypothetical protein BT93_K0466 [Corymbia citriodora subsp. variegata]
MDSLCSLPSFFLSFSFVLLSPFSNFIDAQAQGFDYPTTPLSKRWTNNTTANQFTHYDDGSIVQAILLRGKETLDPAFACGFYCNGTCNSYLFAVFIIQVDSSGLIDNYTTPQVVWSANRNNPVKIDTTLELMSEGDLVLKDVGGTVAWSTNTAAKFVVGLNLTDLGNLVLFDENNATVWQSFDHPTDSLVLGQKLRKGQRLLASASKINWTFDGTISFSINGNALSAQMETNPPRIYFKCELTETLYLRDPYACQASIPHGSDSYARNSTFIPDISYVELENRSLSWFSYSTWNGNLIDVPPASSIQYLKLGSDGHLRVYEFTYSDGGKKWPMFSKGLLEIVPIRHCPALSGRESYFKQVDNRRPNLGCSEIVPLSCEASKHQSLLELENITYLSLTPNLKDIDASSCKEAYTKNCSCKVAIFRYESNRTSGLCYLLTQVFSLMNTDNKEITYYSIAYLKVQNVRRSHRLLVILGSSLGALFIMVIFVVAIVLFVQRRDDNQAEEDYLDQVPGMSNRFTYDDLKTITNEFGKKLGEGGFGSVFEGTLSNGTKVAVKRLDGFGQVKKSFLAKIETIGSIHHVNLVRLVGFCAEKSHRLLVYECMSNGSLDKWIFHKSNECILDWQQRKKIILDIAKGLNYLHEDCRQKIIHLDIKPQNILLDGNFNAKVADFGLSKLIDRDQSHVVTTMRGTLGYLAPEWLRAAITEKVDVYSFGVVILEIVCGRKIFDHSLDEEGMDLLSLFKRKVEEERLLDIVDKSSDDMQLNKLHAMNMMRVATWCLQRDYIKRPSMSMVIKALEGIVEVQEDLDYDFSAQPSTSGAAGFGRMDVELSATTVLLPSILSGP